MVTRFVGWGGFSQKIPKIGQHGYQICQFWSNLGPPIVNNLSKNDPEHPKGTKIASRAFDNTFPQGWS